MTAWAWVSQVTDSMFPFVKQARRCFLSVLSPKKMWCVAELI